MRSDDLPTESDGTAPSWVPHPSDYNVPTPEDLRRLREESGLSLRDVAAKVGVNKDSIRRWELGETEPSLGNGRDLLHFYQAEIEEEEE
ncbi:helix-turn-helix transcriptional regulator [Halorubrum sp. SD683]|uniref:helix-turn-helix domain-containing protein n=1 Tax=Halorubrum sp. SD683 TaxID=1855873 RepID=UPI00117A57AF|nr:helix-turn-helix transcriptional regulator [Halorubrum sp. SD683]